MELGNMPFKQQVSTHSRLKAAAMPPELAKTAVRVSTHSRLKAAGLRRRGLHAAGGFQHTAA